MFTSVNGSNIELTIDFPNEDNNRRIRKDDVTEETVVVDYETKLAKCRMQRPSRPRQDIVEENIRKITFWNKINAYERKMKSMKLRRRRETAMKRKDKLFKDKLKNKIYYMNRWDIVREKRKDIDKMQKDYQQKQLYKFWWIRKQKTVAALKIVFDLFNNTKIAIKKEYNEKIHTKRIIR